MTPVFYRVNQAINYTLLYYEIERIYPHMIQIAGKETYQSGLLDTYYDLTMKFHSWMEDEIKQTIYTTTRNAQIELFELLKEWLTDVRIKILNQAWILEKIDQHNEKAYTNFLVEVEKKEAAFKSSPNYSKEHLEEYENCRPSGR
jgi:hypothetical protein